MKSACSSRHLYFWNLNVLFSSVHCSLLPSYISLSNFSLLSSFPPIYSLGASLCFTLLFWTFPSIFLSRLRSFPSFINFLSFHLGSSPPFLLRLAAILPQLFRRLRDWESSVSISIPYYFLSSSAFKQWPWNRRCPGVCLPVCLFVCPLIM